MKRVTCLILAAVLILTLCACAPTERKTLTCDRCGKTLSVEAESNMTEEWIILCRECELEAFGEEGLVPVE